MDGRERSHLSGHARELRYSENSEFRPTTSFCEIICRLFLLQCQNAVALRCWHLPNCSGYWGTTSCL